MCSIFTCTACAVTFVDSEAQKVHYKLDWHRYNLRRKVAGLSPVDKSDFDRRLAAALGHAAPKPEFHGRCNECRKSFRSESLYKQHLQSKKHKDAVKAVAAAAAMKANRSTSSSPSTTGGIAAADALGAGGGDIVAVAGATTASVTAMNVVPPTGAAAHRETEVDSGANSKAGETSGTLASSSRILTGTPKDESAGIRAEDKDERGDGDDGPLPPMGPSVCVFCDEEGASFEDNCAHMLRDHGFFIPDVEYLTDPEGLVGYVEEKVKLGKICLYCNGKGKAFHTYRALQQHMRDRSHCKLLYDEDEDMHEYEAFYDFSASYNDAETRGLLKDGDSSSVAEDEASEDDDVQLSRTLGVTDIGELVLLDGRTVGNRKWNRFYKQRLRTVDSREVAVAQKKATSLRLGAMYDAEMRKGMSTGGVVALQRGERKAYGGLANVSRPKDVKMLRAHQRIEARERLKTGLRQNKLNKTFDRVADM